MDNNMNEEQKSGSMLCNSCVHGSVGGVHHGYFLLRLILGLAIIAMVFALGVKVGEFKGMFDNEYQNRYMMRTYPVQNMMYDDYTVPQQ